MFVLKNWVLLFCTFCILLSVVVFCKGTTEADQDIINNSDDTSAHTCNIVATTIPKSISKATSTEQPVRSTTTTQTTTSRTTEVYPTDTVESTETASTITISTSTSITPTDSMAITTGIPILETTVLSTKIPDQLDIDPRNTAKETTCTSTDLNKLSIAPTETEFSTSIEPTKTMPIAIENLPTATVLSAVTPTIATATTGTVVTSTEYIIKTVPPESILSPSACTEDIDSIEYTPELISTVVPVTVGKEKVLHVTEHAKISPTSTLKTYYDIAKTISVTDVVVLNDTFEYNNSSAVTVSTTSTGTTPALPNNTSRVLYL